MGEKNNSTDISSNKLMKSHTRRSGYGQKRETEFPLIIAQINAIKTNVKAKAGKTQ